MLWLFKRNTDILTFNFGEKYYEDYTQGNAMTTIDNNNEVLESIHLFMNLLEQEGLKIVENDADYLQSLQEKELKDLNDDMAVLLIHTGVKRNIDIGLDYITKKYSKRLLSQVYSIVRDYGVAEDILQETLFRAYRYLDKYAVDRRFSRWITTIARNKSIDYLNSAQYRERDATRYFSNEDSRHLDNASYEAVEDTCIGVDDSAIEVNVWQEVYDRLEEMPSGIANAYALNAFSGMKYTEIAEELGCKTGTVRSRISRAREHLAKTVKPMLIEGYHSGEEEILEELEDLEIGIANNPGYN